MHSDSRSTSIFKRKKQVSTFLNNFDRAIYASTLPPYLRHRPRKRKSTDIYKYLFNFFVEIHELFEKAQSGKTFFSINH